MLSDQQARDEFENDLTSNFSVIASPGTGKTTAITHRISNIICNCKNPENLKNFLAVTYTEKAANEIKERVTKNIVEKIEKHSTSSRILNGLNNIFFGTIHSLCAKLLREHHSHIALKKNFEIIENDSKYWESFLTNCSFFEKLNNLEQKILSYFSIEKILNEARFTKPRKENSFQLTLLPQQEIVNLFNYRPTLRERGIKNFQEDLQIWIQSGQNCPLPIFPQTKSKNFLEFLSKNAPNIISWQKNTYLYLTNECAKRYQQFKIDNNVLTYDDLINLALEITSDKIYRKNNIDRYSIILDEAQDTDPEQFKILLNLANKNCYELLFDDQNHKINTSEFSFSMVGDPKQAIYSDRANIKFYMLIHDKLAQTKLIQPLSFNITMRCDQKIVSFVNKKFLPIFSTQTFFTEPMQARLNANQGEIKILKTDDNFETLSQFLNKNFLRDLNIKQYSDIAILSPRKSWLSEIIDNLKQFSGIPKLQLWANTDISDQPSLIKWVVAILHYILSPADKKELAGIFREIFGIPTDKIINYINYNEKNICSELDEKISQLRTSIDQFYIPNFIREIIRKFDILERINILNIFNETQIIEQYSIIMNIAYEAQANQTGYRILEENLIKAYKRPALNDTIPDKNAIQLLTYHKSKGLEWPIVILPFLYREHKLLSCDSENINNEKRMLFVACTRAKHQLFLLDDSSTTAISDRTNMISSGKILDNIM